MGCINSIAWSLDGTELVSASDDKTLKIWSSVTGECISTLEGHSDEVHSVAWSPDRVRLASASNDNTVKVWDEATGKCTLTLHNHEDHVSFVARSPDTLRLASAANDNTIKIWNTSSGQCTSTPKGHSDSVMGLSWSPDAAWLVSASRDNTIKTRDSITGQCLSTLTGHSDQVNWVITVTKVGEQPIVQYASLLECNSEKDKSVPKTDNATLIASASSDGTVRVWDPATRLCTATLEGHSRSVANVTWSPDGNYITSASDDGTVKIWDPKTSLCKLTLENSDCVWEASWSPDGTKLATSLINGAVMIWDIDWNTTTATLASTFKKTTDFTMADPATGDCTTEIALECGRVFTVGWSPEGRLFAFGTDAKAATIWDPTTNQSKMVLEGHTDTVKKLSWSPDENKLVTASYDGTIKVWDPASGNCLVTLEDLRECVLCVAYSPDGSKLVSSSVDNTFKIWDAVQNTCTATLEGHTEAVVAVAWSPIPKPPSPPQPLDSDSDDGLAQWMQDFMDLQDRLRALESDIDGIAEQGVKAAVDSIAKGLSEFNVLIGFWPDYTGNGTTNEERKAISMLRQISSTLLTDIEKKLKEKKAQFTKETATEQAALTTLGTNVQKAVEEMNTNQEAYDEAQSQLLAKVEQISLENAVQHHPSRKDNTILDSVNYTALLNSKGSLDELQQAVELAYLILERAQDKVRSLQLRELAMRRVQKNRPIAQRAITRSEKLVSLLRLITYSLTKESGRILAVANLITPAIKKLATVGEPPYHRPNRLIENDLCTTILIIHRESLMDAAFAESARDAMAQVREWFDEDIPKRTQEEIDAIVKNPLY
ncbi:WD40-repeat-containing domain protein [Trichoderma evansii]